MSNIKYFWVPALRRFVLLNLKVSNLRFSGYKMSKAVCKNRLSGEEMDELLCNVSEKPAAKIVECNDAPCSSKWAIHEWGPCSASCGGGVRKREVYCSEEVNLTKIKVCTRVFIIKLWELYQYGMHRSSKNGSLMGPKKSVTRWFIHQFVDLPYLSFVKTVTLSQNLHKLFPIATAAVLGIFFISSNAVPKNNTFSYEKFIRLLINNINKLRVS